MIESFKKINGIFKKEGAHFGYKQQIMQIKGKNSILGTDYEYLLEDHDIEELRGSWFDLKDKVFTSICYSTLGPMKIYTSEGKEKDCMIYLGEYGRWFRDALVL